MIENTRDAMIDAVYARIHARLGGQHGNTPHARFGHAADYKPAGDGGVLQFVVTIADGINRGRRRTIRHNWRENYDSTSVSTALLNEYHRLLAPRT